MYAVKVLRLLNGLGAGFPAQRLNGSLTLVAIALPAPLVALEKRGRQEGVRTIFK